MFWWKALFLAFGDMFLFRFLSILYSISLFVLFCCCQQVSDLLIYLWAHFILFWYFIFFIIMPIIIVFSSLLLLCLSLFLLKCHLTNHHGLSHVEVSCIFVFVQCQECFFSCSLSNTSVLLVVILSFWLWLIFCIHLHIHILSVPNCLNHYPCFSCIQSVFFSRPFYFSRSFYIGD